MYLVLLRVVWVGYWPMARAYSMHPRNHLHVCTSIAIGFPGHCPRMRKSHLILGTKVKSILAISALLVVLVLYLLSIST